MKKVTIYSTPTCGYCEMVKEFFKEKKIDYAEKDVSIDDKAREEMVDRSHQMGVPVIDIEGEIFVGFDKDALSNALGI